MGESSIGEGSSSCIEMRSSDGEGGGLLGRTIVEVVLGREGLVLQ